jgi:putative ABC transport system permease protein
MAQTFQGLREGTIRGGTGHLQLSDADASPGAVGLEHGLAGAEGLVQLVAEDDEVRDVLPRIDFVGLVSNGTLSLPFLGVGLDGPAEARAMDYPQLIHSGDWLRGRDERRVVLAAGLARALEVAVGESVTLLATTPDGILNAVDADVAGIVDLPVRELDDRYLATSLGLAADLLQAPDRVSKLVVVLRETEATEGTRSRLLAALGDAGIRVRVRTWREEAVFYAQVRLLYFGIFGFMGIVLLSVVLLASANTMLMAAAERTREIGTLRALGTRSAMIRRMFLAEGLLLGLLACAAGVALSLLVRFVLNHSGIVLPPPPGSTRGFPLHLEVYGLAYAAGALSMTGTVTLASYLAARRAARLPIVKALTHV